MPRFRLKKICVGGQMAKNCHLKYLFNDLMSAGFIKYSYGCHVDWGPVDFFGDGARVPLIVVSPYSEGGHVDHTYYDHASIVKFIEHNWDLEPISNRSRDNLPNPRQLPDNPYVPVNSPAIGDLFPMFVFHSSDSGRIGSNPFGPMN